MTHPKADKPPRLKGRTARVGYLVGDEMFYPAPSKGEKSVPYALIECRTAKEAKAVVKLHGMEPTEMIRRLMLATLPYAGQTTMTLSEGQARAVLKTLNLPTP